MAIRFKIWVLGLVCCSISLPATVMAENYFHTTYNSYITLDWGQSQTKGTCTDTYVSDAYCHEGGVNYRISFGHQFTPTWGMEFGYGDFGRAVEQGVIWAPSPAPLELVAYTWRWESGGWQLSGTGTLHFGNSFSLIGKVGVLRANAQTETLFQDSTGTWWHSVGKDYSNNVSGGIAAQYDFNRDYAARILYEYYGRIGSASKIKSSAVSACLVLKF